jgi:hypothetical protein
MKTSEQFKTDMTMASQIAFTAAQHEYSESAQAHRALSWRLARYAKYGPELVNPSPVPPHAAGDEEELDYDPVPPKATFPMQVTVMMVPQPHAASQAAPEMPEYVTHWIANARFWSKPDDGKNWRDAMVWLSDRVTELEQERQALLDQIAGASAPRWQP